MPPGRRAARQWAQVSQERSPCLCDSLPARESRTRSSDQGGAEACETEAAHLELRAQSEARKKEESSLKRGEDEAVSRSIC